MRFGLRRSGLRSGRRWGLVSCDAWQCVVGGVIPGLSAQCGVFETSGMTHPVTQYRLTNTDVTTSSQKLWDLMWNFCTRFRVQLEARLLTSYASLTVMLTVMLCRNPVPNFGKRKSTNCPWFAFHKINLFCSSRLSAFLSETESVTDRRTAIYVHILYICVYNILYIKHTYCA